MDNQKMGQFICALRKEKKMTQKDLATKLNVTDKAVSKWERGLSCPDISLLSSLAGVLGVTVSDLLNGEKGGASAENFESSVGNALDYAKEAQKDRWKAMRDIFALSYSILLLIGILVCSICDIAISGAFSWSLIPISAIVFSWLVFFPAMKWGAKGVFVSMLSLNVFIVPFLYVLDRLIGATPCIMPVGVPMAVISLVFLWCVLAVFWALKKRKLLAAAISFLLSIPTCFFINLSLSRLIGGPVIDSWDIVSFGVLGVLSLTFFLQDFKRKTVRKE